MNYIFIKKNIPSFQLINKSHYIQANKNCTGTAVTEYMRKNRFHKMSQPFSWKPSIATTTVVNRDAADVLCTGRVRDINTTHVIRTQYMGRYAMIDRESKRTVRKSGDEPRAVHFRGIGSDQM